MYLKWTTDSVRISQAIQSVCTCCPPVTPGCAVWHTPPHPGMLCTNSCPLPPLTAPLPRRQRCPVLLQPLWYLTVRVHKPCSLPCSRLITQKCGEVSFLHEAFRSVSGASPPPLLPSFLHSLPPSCPPSLLQLPAL